MAVVGTDLEVAAVKVVVFDVMEALMVVPMAVAVVEMAVAAAPMVLELVEHLVFMGEVVLAVTAHHYPEQLVVVVL